MASTEFEFVLRRPANTWMKVSMPAESFTGLANTRTMIFTLTGVFPRSVAPAADPRTDPLTGNIVFARARSPLGRRST